MEIRIRLPGWSAASDLFLAPPMATAAVRHAQGLPALMPAPAGASNPCAEDPACVYLETVIDSQGVKWLLYICDEVVEAYRA